jgi:predicted RNA-binding protein
MCIATVYIETGGELNEVMRDVIRIEAENSRFRLINLIGEEKSIGGKLKHIDFWQDHSVVIEQ